MLLYIAVDKDGTEKVSNHTMFDGGQFAERMLKSQSGRTCYNLSLGYKCSLETSRDHMKGVWCDDVTRGVYSVPCFTGTILPPGALKQLYGKEIKHSDGVVSIVF